MALDSDNIQNKSRLISRRMFLLTIGKAIVVVGVLGRLIISMEIFIWKIETIKNSNFIL